MQEPVVTSEPEPEKQETAVADEPEKPEPVPTEEPAPVPDVEQPIVVTYEPETKRRGFFAWLKSIFKK